MLKNNGKKAPPFSPGKFPCVGSCWVVSKFFFLSQLILYLLFSSPPLFLPTSFGLFFYATPPQYLLPFFFYDYARTRDWDTWFLTHPKVRYIGVLVFLFLYFYLCTWIFRFSLLFKWLKDNLFISSSLLQLSLKLVSFTFLLGSLIWRNRALHVSTLVLLPWSAFCFSTFHNFIPFV